MGTALALLHAQLRGQMQYRLNFALMVLMGLVWQLTGFAFVVVVVLRFHTLQGWTFPQLAFLYGLRLTAHGVFSVPLGHCYLFDQLVRDGEFDTYLVRPMNPLLQFVLRRMQVNGFGDLLGGVALLTTAIVLAGVAFTPLMAAYLVLAIIGGALIEAGLHIGILAMAFRFVDTSQLPAFVDAIFGSIGNYPLSLFGEVKWALTVALPVAFVAYLPASVVLGQTSGLYVPLAVAYLSPLIGLVWFAAAYLLWRSQLRHYTSVGS